MFSGGLGIATLGIVKSLSSRASVTLILPTVGDATSPKDFNLIGLNHMAGDEVLQEKNADRFRIPVYEIPIALSPYHHVNFQIRKDEVKNRDVYAEQQLTGSYEKVTNTFSSGEIYGPDILFKVHLFSTLAERISKRCDFDVITPTIG